MSQLFAWGSQNTGVSALASFLPKKSQGWSPSECTGWISLQSKGLSRVLQHHSSKASILWRSAFFTVQLSHPHVTTGKTISSVTQSCPALCDPMNHSTPGLRVHYQLLEFTQTHVHQVSDTIQPSHPLSFPYLPARNPSQCQGLFQWVNSSHEVAKVLEFQLQHQSFQWTPRTGLLYDGLVGSPCSPRDSQESFPTPQFKHQLFGNQLSSQSNSDLHTWPQEKP